jgi:hypothetical protein
MPVEIQSGDGGTAETKPRMWRVNSAACLSVSVNSAGPDGGRLAAVDGGVAETNTLYRCVAGSGNAGDICYRSDGVFIPSCTGATLAVQIVPGGELYTKLVPTLSVQSSSGAATMSCCPMPWD